MATKRCKNEVLFDKIGLNKIDHEKSEFALTVLENLPDCRRINANKFLDIRNSEGQSSTGARVYSRFLVPKASLECGGEWCANTGTLVPGVAGSVIYRIPGDATEWANGVITFYLKDVASGDNINVMVSSAEDFTNADQYTVSIGSGIAYDEDAGFYVAAVDLSKAGTDVGSGWTPSTGGAYLSIGVPTATIGISSIAIFDSMEDFAVNNVVIIGCLNSESMDIAIEAAEATCFADGYDTSSEPDIDLTVEGNSVTPNYYLLNPLDGKGEATTGFERATIERTVQSDGTVTLSDAYQEECGFLSCALADNCDVTNSQLYRLSIPVLIDMDENQYIVMKDGENTVIHFNTALAGQVVRITYPREVEVEERVDSMTNLNRGVKVRGVQTVYTTDGNKIVYVYDNLLVTSFPHTISQDETTFSFTLRLRKDAKGVLRRTYFVRG